MHAFRHIDALSDVIVPGFVGGFLGEFTANQVTPWLRDDCLLIPAFAGHRFASALLLLFLLMFLASANAIRVGFVRDAHEMHETRGSITRAVHPFRGRTNCGGGGVLVNNSDFILIL